MFGRHNQTDFIDRVLNAHNDYRVSVGSPPLEWDPQLANCAYVSACFQQIGHYGNRSLNSVEIGLRQCNSYTCGGVTCHYSLNIKNIASFIETTEGDGYITQGGTRAWIESPGQNRKAVRNEYNKRLGCATYGNSKFGLLYCGYAQKSEKHLCVCQDRSCCDNCYPNRLISQCNAIVTQSGIFQEACTAFPDATHAIVEDFRSKPSVVIASSVLGDLKKTKTSSVVEEPSETSNTVAATSVTKSSSVVGDTPSESSSIPPLSADDIPDYQVFESESLPLKGLLTLRFYVIGTLIKWIWDSMQWF